MADCFQAVRLTPPVATHGEGAFWDEEGRRLLFVDLLDGDILAYSRGRVARHELPIPVAAMIRSRADGEGFVIAAERDLLLTDHDFRVHSVLATVIDANGGRLNDGTCAPNGDLLIGSMAHDEHESGGALFRVTVTGDVARLLTATISNGVQFGPESSTAFYVDSSTHRIDRLEFDAHGGVLRRSLFANIEETQGVPDGMAIDSAGDIWVAVWDGGVVQRYDQTGKLAEIVNVPGAQRVTSCAFGGRNLDTLFITTSRLGVTDPDQTGAGALYAYRPRTRGHRPYQFGRCP